MKKLLIVHTKYQNIGGEDIAVENEIKSLSKFFNVDTLLFQNDNQLNFRQIRYFLSNNNLDSVGQLNNKISNFNPDVVYVHNTWFKGSLGIFKLLENKNVKTVIKLHNFRYLCTKSIMSKKHLEGEQLCKACGYTKTPLNIFNKYFKESFLKSVLILIYGKKYFKILKSSKFLLLVLTNFHKNKIKKLNGFKSKVFVHPNPIRFDLKTSVEEKSNSILYAGRISNEKGVDKLIESFQNAQLGGINLNILGDGPLLKKLRSKYNNFEKINFLGEQPNNKVLELIEKSLLVVTATRLYEGQPTLLCEASSLGIPSIFPNTGGIEEFFPKNYPLSYDQFDYLELEKKLKIALDISKLEEIGKQNKDFIQNYLNEKKLIDSFNMIIDG